MEHSYDVVYFPSALDEFRDLFHRAKTIGHGQKVLQAGGLIDGELRSDPITFGDPTHTLPSLGLRVFSRTVSPLHINYAVHENEGVVFVTRFTAAAGLDF
jgi:hypothetical protein